MALPTFHIPPDGISGVNAVFAGDELSHARLTLRLKPGDGIRVVDGEGRSWRGEIRSLGRETGRVTLTGGETEPEPSFKLTVAMGIVQGERFDWAVQKATELGAWAFVPLVTERTEGRFKGTWKRLDRLRRVIASACKQCGRARFPAISPPAALDRLETAPYDLCLVFWEEGGRRPLKEISDEIRPPNSCLLVFGPVGGLTGGEVDLLQRKGCAVIGLGSRILRTETAVTAGVALAQYLWGDLG